MSHTEAVQQKKRATGGSTATLDHSETGSRDDEEIASPQTWVPDTVDATADAKGKDRSAAAPKALDDGKVRVHVWPTKAVRRRDEVARGLATADKAETKALKKSKEADVAGAQGLWSLLKQICGGRPGCTFDDASFRLDLTWTLQMAKDIANLNPSMFEMVETSAAKAEAANRQINLNEDTKQRMEEFAGDDSYDELYTEELLDALAVRLKEAEADEQIRSLMEADQSGDDSGGFIISESHGVDSTWKFLHDQMGSLKDNGVVTIYLEHFRHSEYQPMLDEYFEPTTTKMPANLLAYIKKFDSKHTLKAPYSLHGVVTRAKADGLRIVGIDDQGASRQSAVNSGNELESRAARMNTTAEAIVKRDQSLKAHKFVMVMGAKHTHDHVTADGTEFEHGIAGVAQLLSLLAVRLNADGSSVELHRREDVE